MHYNILHVSFAVTSMYTFLSHAHFLCEYATFTFTKMCSMHKLAYCVWSCIPQCNALGLTFLPVWWMNQRWLFFITVFVFSLKLYIYFQADNWWVKTLQSRNRFYFFKAAYEYLYNNEYCDFYNLWLEWFNLFNSYAFLVKHIYFIIIFIIIIIFIKKYFH